MLASCTHASGPAVEAAQQLVRTIRLRGSGFTVSAAGFGAGGTNTQTVSSPPGALLLDGLHVIVVGTTDAVRIVVQSHTQMRSVFSDPVVLQPLKPNEFHLLLEARYPSLRLDPGLPVHATVRVPSRLA